MKSNDKLKAPTFLGYWPSITLMGLSILMSSCSTLEGFFSSTPENPPAPMAVELGNDGRGNQANPIRFSENPNIGSFNERRYRRVTRKSLEEENEVGSRAGSLWNTEGPGSYLFTQNKVHREGDLLNVKLEGTAKNQVDTKIKVIQQLLARLEIKPSATPNSPSGGAVAQNEASARTPAGENPPNSSSSNTSDKKLPEGVANGAVGAAGDVASTAAKTTGEGAAETPINVSEISTRVTERLGDGNYRVKGQQSILIGKKEFKVILTGLIRPEDFSDEGVSSNKVLDSQVDIVSLKRSLE